MTSFDLKMPKYPECWKTCGNCGSGDILIDEVCVAVGDEIEADQTVIVLETGKVALDIPSNHGGRILEIAVKAGDLIAEGQLILRVEKS